MIQLRIQNYSEREKKTLMEALKKGAESIKCPNPELIKCIHCINKKVCYDIANAIDHLTE